MKARKRAAPRYKARRAPLRGRRAPMRGPARIRRKKPTGQKRRLRAKAPEIPLTSRGSPPSYFELLQEAVLTLKEAGKGASLPEIRRQLQKKYKGRFDKAGNKLLTTALQCLAKRGKVICKKGYKFTFNAPKVSKAKPEKPANGSASSSAYTGTSRSGATSGSAPTESDATGGRSVDDSQYTSASSSSSGTNRSGKSAKDEGPKDEAPKDDESPENGDGEEKSSTGDLSSSAPSASSTAYRRASSKKR